MSSEDKALDITIENVGILRERLERAEIALQTIAELPIAEQDNILDRMVPSDLRLLVGERDKLEAENQALKAKSAECQHMLADIVVRHFAENITRSTAQKSMDVYLSEGIRLLEEELEALRARVVVVPERIADHEPKGEWYRTGWNACLDELARLNGKTVSMADIRACLDAELREWTGDHRKAVEVALTDSAVRISALLDEGKEVDGLPEQHLLPCPFCGAPAHSIRATKHAEDCYFLADERLRNAKNADLSGVPAVLRGWNKRHIPADQVLVARDLVIRAIALAEDAMGLDFSEHDAIRDEFRALLQR